MVELAFEKTNHAWNERANSPSPLVQQVTEVIEREDFLRTILGILSLEKPKAIDQNNHDWHPIFQLRTYIPVVLQ